MAKLLQTNEMTMDIVLFPSTDSIPFSIIKIYRREELSIMKIHVSHEAAEWYKDELYLKKGDFVRFFARYGGVSTFQQGFSLGLSTDKPEDVGVSEEIDGVTFFIEDKDMWYFDDKDLFIDFNKSDSEPEFRISE